MDAGNQLAINQAAAPKDAFASHLIAQLTRQKCGVPSKSGSCNTDNTPAQLLDTNQKEENCGDEDDDGNRELVQENKEPEMKEEGRKDHECALPAAFFGYRTDACCADYRQQSGDFGALNTPAANGQPVLRGVPRTGKQKNNVEKKTQSIE